MNKASMDRLAPARAALAVLLLAAAATAFAQSSDPSAGQFGDRQAGRWGDPGQGHFGNPAEGAFDRSGIRTPQPGTRPLGKVMDKNMKPIEPPPYVTLPNPVDQAKAVEAKKAPAKKKKRAKKSPAN